jgi:hypothetical protein
MNEKVQFYRYTGESELDNYVTVMISGENKPAVSWIRGLINEVIPSDIWDSYSLDGKWIESGEDIKSTVNWIACYQAQMQTEEGQAEVVEERKRWAIIKARLAVEEADKENEHE